MAGYIGNFPTAIPLASSDLADGLVTTAKLADSSVTAPKVKADLNFRNLIINGDMSIAQRGTSQASISSGGYYTCDRWRTKSDGSFGAFTQSQDTDVPTGQGFANSLKMDCTSTHTITANDALQIEHRLEGQMLQMLKKGTSNAESVTLSFWVKSNKTGTYIAELFDADNTRTINKSYTINSSNTWEKKTITYAGDTTGAFDSDNALSLYLIFWLGAGSTYTSGTLSTSWQARVNGDRAVGQVNLADSTDNNFWITGVQLEVGTSASDFEFLPHDVNLVRCQRYYQQLNQNGSNGWCTFSGVRNGTADVQNIGIPLPTPLRIGNPTVTKSSSSLMQAWDGDGYHITSSGGSGSMTVPVNSGNDTPYLMVNTNGFTGLDTGGSISWSIVLGTPSAEFDAEL